MAKAVMLDAFRPGPYIALMEEEFERAGIEFVKEGVEAEDDIIRVCADADLIVSGYTTMNRHVMENLPKCKAIVRCGIGVDMLDVPAATERGIMILNVHDYCYDEVATHAMALMLALVRKIVPYNQSTHAGKWAYAEGYTMRRLSALTLGVVGFGHIGRLFASYAKPFGFTIIAYDPYAPQSLFDDAGVERVELDDLFARADIISLHTPLSEETHHMVNKASIAKMKQDVMLINVSRGGLINTADLAEAVKEGRVQAAGVDVLEEEPVTDADFPLYKVDNVIVTPHAAHASAQATPELFRRAAATLCNAWTGNGPYNCINARELAARK